MHRKVQKCQAHLPQPNLIHKYNAKMGDINQMDGYLIALTNCKRPHSNFWEKAPSLQLISTIEWPKTSVSNPWSPRKIPYSLTTRLSHSQQAKSKQLTHMHWRQLINLARLLWVAAFQFFCHLHPVKIFTVRVCMGCFPWIKPKYWMSTFRAWYSKALLLSKRVPRSLKISSKELLLDVWYL